jgi:hypothetical protein
MPRVCKAVIKAKGGNFGESQTVFGHLAGVISIDTPTTSISTYSHYIIQLNMVSFNFIFGHI